MAPDARGLSALSESLLEKSLLKRGLATPEEIAACKAHREKLAGTKDEKRGLLEVLVAAKVVTQSQAGRLLKEIGNDAPRTLSIPGYTHLEKLGKGSMGVVYRARQTSVDRVVAIKVLLDSLAQNKDFINRFQREAMIAAKLSHSNIVNAIDAGEVDGHYYFVMEYVEGKNIKDELDAGKVYEEAEAIRIILAVAEALKHAHERGLIHRDIKPENIILTKDGGVKLADLGLARLTADEKWAMSEAGMAIGTPYYISPEQVRGQVDVDIRADIYSLGATLYHMVAGKVPYDGETPPEVMRKHIDKKNMATPVDHVNTRLSSGMGEVVETMMAKDREDRYRNPSDLILDLKCLQQGERPMIAQQKADDLAGLAEGESDEDGGPGVGMSDASMREVAGYVNSRMTIIMTLAILLAVSVVSNVLVLATR
jgi:serine/threonine-protein kinase